MPFTAGNQEFKKRKANKGPGKKTIWVLESLLERGFDYEAMLVKFLTQAADGDRKAYAMAELLIKLVPHLANAPKRDAAIPAIETLVINRYEHKAIQPEGHPPLATDAEIVNTTEQH